LQYIELGKTRLRASRLGAGCSRIASLSTAYSPTEIRRTLLAAFDHGVNFFDTADIYGQGDSERLLGKIYQDRRDQVIFCTKAGLTVKASQVLIRLIKPGLNPLIRRSRLARNHTTSVRREIEQQCFDPEFLRRRIYGSLKRLRTDFLDIFLLHSPPVSVLRDEAVWVLLENLKQDGIIKHYGVSCDSVEVAMVALGCDGISCIQVPVHPLQPEMSRLVLPTARTQGIGVIAREPLAGGALFSFPPVMDLCSRKGDCNPAHIGFCYSMQQEVSSVIVAGMSNELHLEQGLAALEATPLSADEMALLDTGVQRQGSPG